MFWFLFNVLKFIFLLVFPFILLIRGSVFLHEEYQLIPWASILGGVLMTAFVMVIYFTFFYGRFTGKIGSIKAFKRRGLLALLLVLGYSLYGILFFSTKNFKHPGLQDEMTNIHPIIRLGVSTLVHLDKSLIITDAERVPEDYRKMGLKTKAKSLHYKQSDGYSHALDLRTNGRGEFRNFLVKWYFKLMGFNTLRHVGTGDHLHISLKSFDSPYAI